MMREHIVEVGCGCVLVFNVDVDTAYLAIIERVCPEAVVMLENYGDGKWRKRDMEILFDHCERDTESVSDSLFEQGVSQMCFFFDS